jgi:hypothetical protein
MLHVSVNIFERIAKNKKLKNGTIEKPSSSHDTSGRFTTISIINPQCTQITKRTAKTSSTDKQKTFKIQVLIPKKSGNLENIKK